jgi:hypothetical protein
MPPKSSSRLPTALLIGRDDEVLDDWELGTLLGAGDFVGGSEASLLGFCDGWELGTLLGAGGFIGASEDSLLGFCAGWELGTLLGAGDFVGGS